MVIPLVQLDRCPNGQGQALQESGAERAAAETEGILIQIGLKIFLRQAMIGFTYFNDDI